MKIVKRILKLIGYVLSILIVYLIISLILTVISVNKDDQKLDNNKSVYLHTNGVHLDVIIHKNDINPHLLKSIFTLEHENYISFGWGDENFYINTPTWGDLTFKNAFSAMFLKSSTLMHLTRYKSKNDNWVLVKLSDAELKKLNDYILNTFTLDDNDNVIILSNTSYSSYDDFYKANGSYSCFNTCNSWVNRGFKTSGLKACLWTPFDFGLLNNYN